MTDLWDIVVIGAGAAGLLAAIRAGLEGRKVLLLEKNRKPGVKILMSGGTRCNITHDTDNRGIVAAYGPPGRFLHSALATFSVQQTIDFFESAGVAVKVEETGKVFPVSNRAVDVLDALLRQLRVSGAVLSLEESVTSLEPNDEGFTLQSVRRTIAAKTVILTTGGKSYPGSGTTGDGYRFAEKLGHTIIPPRPALVPVRIGEEWVSGLRGVTLPRVEVSVVEGANSLCSRTGSLLFAHFGLTGPVVLDVSRFISGHSDPRTLSLQIDLLPDLSADELTEFLRRESIDSSKKQLAVVLSSLLPRRICDAILHQLGLPEDRKCAGLSKTDRTRIVQAMKRLRLSVSGTLGFEKAEVTAGGIALDEVDSRNMQSKLVPNLYFAGEVLDLDGPIGGYNFQAAWSTGWLAGESAAERVGE